VHIWDIQFGALVHTLDGFPAPITCLEIEKGMQGRRPNFAVGGSMDHTARVREIAFTTIMSDKLTRK
jgi:hypothetical protein